MFYSGRQDQGTCPTGGAHSAHGDHFQLPFNASGTANAQASWRFCDKCYVMFYAGRADQGNCAAGGAHAAEGYDFVLPHDIPVTPVSQASWRFCDKCDAMFYDGRADQGHCPAGGAHAASGYDFVLPVVPAAAPLGGLAGSSQYVFSSPTPLMNLVVEIKIAEAIQVSPQSGVTPSSQDPKPIGFQINGFSPNADQTAGDKTVGWQQYGVKMWPDTNTLVSFSESWPVAAETQNLPNTFQISSQIYNGSSVTLPNDLTIPAGWTIRFKFSQQSDGTITGFDCSVTDANGTSVGPDLGIALMGQNVLAAGGEITEGDLAQLVAFQVVLVGFWDSAQATLLSGAGTITCSSSTTMTVGASWPSDASGNFGTAEDTNSTYGLVPAEPSTSITQTFGVTG
jgi:hypothetical protein